MQLVTQHSLFLSLCMSPSPPSRNAVLPWAVVTACQVPYANFCLGALLTLLGLHSTALFPGSMLLVHGPVIAKDQGAVGAHVR